MVFIPFIWISLLFLFIWKKRRLDISAYATLWFVISSLFSIILVNSPDGMEFSRYPSVFSTIVYCLGNSLIIWPLYRFDVNSLQGIVIRNEKTINFLTYLFFSVFIILVLSRWKTLVFIFTVADWESLRAMAHDDEIVIENYTGIIKLVTFIAKLIGMASSVMVPVFFISICYLKRSWWFYLMAILGSANVIINGFIGFDRSSTFRWLLLLGFCTVMFWKYISKKAQKRIVPVIIAILSGSLLYFAAVTEARFENTAQGSQGSLIEYAGQPYLYFCNIYDRLDNGEGITTKYIFPTIHKYIFNDYEGNVPRQNELTNRTGIKCNVFYSVLGSFVLDANQPGPYLYIIYYLLIYAILFHQRRKRRYISLSLFLCFYFMMQIAVFGIIAYNYTVPLTKIIILLLLLFVKLSENKTRRFAYREGF